MPLPAVLAAADPRSDAANNPRDPALIGGRAAACLLLIAAVLLMAGVRAARFDERRWSHDAVAYFGFVESARSVLDADYLGRRHPLFFLALRAVDRLAGPRLWPLLALVYLGHLAAVLGLARLVVALGGPERAGLTAGLLLAVFPGANNLFADPIHFERTWALAAALGALLALARGRPALYVALYAASVATFEDAALLPVAGLLLHPRARAAHAAAFAVLATVIALSPTGGLAPGWHVIAQGARLPFEVARAAFAFHADLVAPRALRLLPGALLLAAVVLGARPRSTPRRPLLLLLLLTVVLAAPYLARPTGDVWPSRYLYFPSAPLLAAGALVLATAPRGRLALLLAWAALVGVTSAELASDRIVERHLHRFATDEARLAAATVAAAHDGKAVAIRLTGEGCAFLARVPAPQAIPCSPP